MSFDALVRALDEDPDPATVRPEVLRSALADTDELARIVATAEPEQQLDEVRGLRVPEVEPTVWPLLRRPGRYDVMLNIYNPERFELLRCAGSITPHRHHFSFASVVLGGGLAHFVFDNDGELDEPRLRPRSQEHVGPAGRLELRWDEYHCVLAPRPGTVTLMVRGAPVSSNPFLGDPDYDRAQFEADRTLLLDALAAGTPESAS